MTINEAAEREASFKAWDESEYRKCHSYESRDIFNEGWAAAARYYVVRGYEARTQPQPQAIDGEVVAKADEHTTKEIAQILCITHFTDGFCGGGKEGCICQRLAKECTRAIRFRQKFTRPEVAALATLPQPSAQQAQEEEKDETY